MLRTTACLTALWLTVPGANAAESAGPSAARPAAAMAAKPPARSGEVSTNVLKAGSPDQAVLQVAHAVMVTVELDFGNRVPTIADALKLVERRHHPVDGAGRTFAILDAYGGPAPNGKLHMSMHVSAEKPGVGSLIFKPTGEVLWHSQIGVGTNSAARKFDTKKLMILLDDGAGHTITVDGSNRPRTILDAIAKEMGIPVRQMWPEGAEREVTFVYSACGCPVKVTAMRIDNKTTRTTDLPVLFPDDPAVVKVIEGLMGW